MTPILGIMASQISGHLETGAFESIATVTATGSETELIFNSIPSTFKSLQIRGTARRNGTGSFYPNITFNSDSGANYARHNVIATSGVISAGATANTTYVWVPPMTSNSQLTNNYGVINVDILDYASLDKFKTVKMVGGFDNNGSGILHLASSLWQSTSAINSIRFYAGGDIFESGSTYALYGIKG